MSYLRLVENTIESIQSTGLWNGKPAQIFNLKGRRAGFTSTSILNDVKEFGSAIAEIPLLPSSTLDIISTSALDTNTAGTGARKVKVVYLNSSNALVESPDINLNGITLVTSVLTGVNEVLWMEVTDAGSGGRAAGNILLRGNGGVTEVEQISAQGNLSLSGRFMVPAGYTGYLVGWRAHALGNDQDVRLAATVNTLNRTLSTVYKYQATAAVASNTNSAFLPLNFLKVPALARIKVSTISGGTAASVRCDVNFNIIIVQN